MNAIFTDKAPNLSAAKKRKIIKGKEKKCLTF
jgi:hypothetical protein